MDSSKRNWVDFIGDFILYCFCAYRISVDLSDIFIKASDTPWNLSYEWIFENYWAELDAAIAVMAFLGILSRRRFVFCFTALFFILHTVLALSTCTHNLHSLLQRHPIWSEQCYDEVNMHSIQWCRMMDTLYLLGNCVGVAILATISTTVCVRLLYVVSNKKHLPTHVIPDPRRPLIREPHPQLIPLHQTSKQSAI